MFKFTVIPFSAVPCRQFRPPGRDIPLTVIDYTLSMCGFPDKKTRFVLTKNPFHKSRYYNFFLAGIPKRINRLPGCCLVSRIQAKKHTDQNRKCHRQPDHLHIHGKAHGIIHNHSCRFQDQPGKTDSRKASHQTYQQCFNEKLQHNSSSSCANRLSDTDLSCSLCYRYQHDIHDPDSTDQQRYGCDSSDHQRHGVSDTGHGFHDF